MLNQVIYHYYDKVMSQNICNISKWKQNASETFWYVRITWASCWKAELPKSKIYVYIYVHDIVQSVWPSDLYRPMSTNVSKDFRWVVLKGCSHCTMPEVLSLYMYVCISFPYIDGTEEVTEAIRSMWIPCSHVFALWTKPL